MGMKSKRYIACDEFIDFGWSYDEVLEFERLWNEGYNLTQIAKYFKRLEEEVLMLVIDRSMKGAIKRRPLFD